MVFPGRLFVRGHCFTLQICFCLWWSVPSALPGTFCVVFPLLLWRAAQGLTFEVSQDQRKKSTKSQVVLTRSPTVEVYKNEATTSSYHQEPVFPIKYGCFCRGPRWCLNCSMPVGFVCLVLFLILRFLQLYHLSQDLHGLHDAILWLQQPATKERKACESEERRIKDTLSTPISSQSWGKWTMTWRLNMYEHGLVTLFSIWSF